MSRFDACEDSDWSESQQHLWDQAVRSTLRGKRGLKVLQEVEAALVALPEPRLISGQMADAQGCTCAVGAWAKARLEQGQPVKSGYGNRAVTTVADLMEEGEDCYETAEFGKVNGLGYALAWSVAQENDDDRCRETPEQRHVRVLAWVRRNIAANPYYAAKGETR